MNMLLIKHKQKEIKSQDQFWLSFESGIRRDLAITKVNGSFA